MQIASLDEVADIAYFGHTFRLAISLEVYTKMKLKQHILAISLAILTAGPVAAQDDSNTSYDGLIEIKKGEFKRTWVDPDVDFTQYTKYLPGGTAFEFRAVKKTSGSAIRVSNSREFYISDEDELKLEDTVKQIFDEELAKSKYFTLADAPGPDVLIIRGVIIDIVSRVPPEMAGRHEIYLSSVGEGTLVLEAVDSLSGDVLYRAAERRAAGSTFGTMPSNTVTNWAEVRRWAKRWATRLRAAMDSIHK